MAKWSYVGFIIGFIITFIILDTLAFLLGTSLYYWLIVILYLGFFVGLMIHSMEMDSKGENNKFLIGYCIGSTGLLIGLIIESLLKPKETSEQIRKEKNREKYQCIRCKYKAKTLEGIKDHINQAHDGTGMELYSVIEA